MSETKRDYEIGYGKPPLGRLFQKGQSGNPGSPAASVSMAALKSHPAPLHNGTLVWYRVIVSMDTLRFRRSCLADGGSSNGRTADSDSASLGSNPSPPASRKRP